MEYQAVYIGGGGGSFSHHSKSIFSKSYMENIETSPYHPSFIYFSFDRRVSAETPVTSKICFAPRRCLCTVCSGKNKATNSLATLKESDTFFVFVVFVLGGSNELSSASCVPLLDFFLEGIRPP